MPIVIGGVLSSLIFLGVLGIHPKPLGFTAAFQARGVIGAGKLLVASVSLLIALRLAPRLLLGLWNVPARSLLGATVFGILVAASLANNNWFTPLDLLLPSLAIISLAGVAAGAEAGSLIRCRFPAKTARRFHTAVDGVRKNRAWRVAAWVLGLILGIVIAGELIHFEEILRLGLHGEFGEAGWTLLVDLYGLHHMLDTLSDLSFSMGATVAVWAWCLCFIASLGVTVRGGYRHLDSALSF